MIFHMMDDDFPEFFGKVLCEQQCPQCFISGAQNILQRTGYSHFEQKQVFFSKETLH